MEAPNHIIMILSVDMASYEVLNDHELLFLLTEEHIFSIILVVANSDTEFYVCRCST